MGKFLPVAIAYGLLCKGKQIFREPSDVGTGPLVATYVFIFSVFLLLWDIRLYPKSLRKLGRLCQCFIEFVIAAFLFENILMDFWFPLEIGVLALPQKAAGLIEDLLATGSWNCPTSLCDGLRSEQTGYVLSYLLSFFFLFAVLQATRAIDLRELECGVGPFIADIVARMKRSFKKNLKAMGFGKHRRVHIKDKKGCGRKRSSSRTISAVKSSDICSDLGDDPTDKLDCYDDDLRHSFSDFEMSLND